MILSELFESIDSFTIQNTISNNIENFLTPTDDFRIVTKQVRKIIKRSLAELGYYDFNVVIQKQEQGVYSALSDYFDGVAEIIINIPETLAPLPVQKVELLSLLTHEFLHLEQFKRAEGRLNDRKGMYGGIGVDFGDDILNTKNYLSDKIEIEAYAMNAAQDLISSYTPEDIKKLLADKPKLIKILSEINMVFNMYHSLFQGTDVMDRFYKKFFQHLKILQNQITEVFDRSIDWTYDVEDEFTPGGYNFSVGDDDYFVQFNDIAEMNNPPIPCKKDEYFDVTLGIIGGSFPYHPTKKFKQYAILSATFDIVKDFLRTPTVKGITFWAFKSELEPIYSKLFKLFQSKMPEYNFYTTPRDKGRNYFVIEKKQINEILDTKIKWEIVNSSKHDVALFRFASKDRTYYVQFNNESNKEQPNNWEIVLYQYDEETKKKSLVTTKSFDQYSVLAALIDIIQYFLKHKQVNSLFFTSTHKNNNDAIYERLLPYMAKKLNLDYKILNNPNHMRGDHRDPDPQGPKIFYLGIKNENK